VTPEEALASPDLINRVAGCAPASPTTVRSVLRGEPSGRVKAARARVMGALAKEGVVFRARTVLSSLPGGKA
jgi:hypothetical protein